MNLAMHTNRILTPNLLPLLPSTAFEDVLPQSKRSAKANYVNLPVAVIPELRKLGVGAFCAYAAITFQAAVERKDEVVVPSRTWKKFGCQPDHRHQQVKALIQAGLVTAVAGGQGKPTRFRLVRPTLTSAMEADAPPPETRTQSNN
jgi:hypothetical protein